MYMNKEKTKMSYEPDALVALQNRKEAFLRFFAEDDKAFEKQNEKARKNILKARGLEKE